MERTTRREDLFTIAFSLWTVIGIFVDAYNHVVNPELETFWTPWHALFYSGFVALASWLVVVRFRYRSEIGTDIFWAPQGYRPAMYGIGIFALGGFGDAIWHELLGVETSFDALLSPTHLLLFVGGSLIISSPFRARWRDRNDSTPSYGDFFPALASLTLATSLAAFFFQYAWAPAQTGLYRIPYEPGNDEFWAVLGFLSIMAATLITFAPLLLASRRWQLPVGAVTTYMVVINLLVIIGFDKEFVGLPSVVLAGFAMDLLIYRAPARWIVVAFPPALMWSSYFALIAIDGDLGWTPELWGGAITFTVLASLMVDRFLDLAVDAAAPTRVESKA